MQNILCCVSCCVLCCVVTCWCRDWSSKRTCEPSYFTGIGAKGFSSWHGSQCSGMVTTIWYRCPFLCNHTQWATMGTSRSSFCLWSWVLELLLKDWMPLHEGLCWIIDLFCLFVAGIWFPGSTQWSTSCPVCLRVLYTFRMSFFRWTCRTCSTCSCLGWIWYHLVI